MLRLSRIAANHQPPASRQSGAADEPGNDHTGFVENPVSHIEILGADGQRARVTPGSHPRGRQKEAVAEGIASHDWFEHGRAAEAGR